MFIRRCAYLLPVAIFSLGIVASSRAQAPHPAPSDGPPGMEHRERDRDLSRERERKDFPKWDDMAQGFEKVKPSGLDEEAFLTLWYNKKTDELFAQIPQGLIGKQFLVASSISGGGFATGFQLDHWLAYWERLDRSLVLMRVDPRYAVDAHSPVSDVVKRSYGDEIVRSVRIRAMKENDPIIDLGDMFKGDFAGALSFGGGGGVSSELSKWHAWKTFGENTELAVDMAVMAGRGAGGGQRIRMHYSLSAIPKSDYQPRVADPRVGYFMTVRYDWGKKYDAKSLFNRYITRWNLKKRDPELALSPPEKQIVWYIEKTVPIVWRRYVAEGILEWNKAFEKCGFVNALQVRQQEDDNEFARVDPEDARYNFFRWIVTGSSFAMGPSRDHPLTGEIFDADIVFDDSMVRLYADRFGRLSGSQSAYEKSNPFLANFFENHPEWRFQSAWGRLMPDVCVQLDPDAEFRTHLLERMSARGRPVCEYAAGMSEQMAVARAGLEGQGLTMEQSEEFLGQIIKEIVMHEVGHCLGLRHNFKASAWKAMDEVARHDDPSTPNVASVMDYNPPIVSKKGDKQGSYTTRSVGPYDYWAIEYGYAVPKKGQPEAEMLKAITARVTESGHDYGTDEDTFGVLSADPLCNRYDMGRDPTGYAKRQIGLVESLMASLTDWGVKENESYSRLRRAFRYLSGERARVCNYIARFVGGQHMYRDHKGDPEARPPIVPVKAETQREALEFVVKNIFSDEAYVFSPTLLNYLAPGRFWHWNSDDFDFEQEFNVHDEVAAGQWTCLFQLMNPFTVNRIHDAELKYDGDAEPYALAEHMERLTQAIWSELDKTQGEFSARKPMISSFRRNLQRMHLQMLLNYVLTDDAGNAPADANAVARSIADGLSERIGKLSLENGSLDAASRAHLRDVKKRIDRALEAEYMVRRGGSGGGISFGHEASPAGKPVEVLPSR